jgi:hypothetical protein
MRKCKQNWKVKGDNTEQEGREERGVGGVAERGRSVTVLVITFMQAFTVIYLKQTVLLGYTVLQLLCI